MYITCFKIMNVELRFDYYSRNLYIPDGYIYDLKKIQEDFFDWLQEQSGCIIRLRKKGYAYSYNENDFERFINEVILKDSQEKAYFVFREHKQKENVLKF